MVVAGGTTGARDASKTRPGKVREPQMGIGTAHAAWQAHIDTLLSIKDDLQKEGGRGYKAAAAQGLEQAIQQARALWAQASKGQDATEERLIRIEASLEKLIKVPLTTKAVLEQS
jgi:hypothetical protein